MRVAAERLDRDKGLHIHAVARLGTRTAQLSHPLPPANHPRRLRLIGQSDIPCLHLVEAFDDGAKLLDAGERMQLEGIVSKRRAAPYRSGECKDWRKVKTEGWRAIQHHIYRPIARLVEGWP